MAKLVLRGLSCSAILILDKFGPKFNSIIAERISICWKSFMTIRPYVFIVRTVKTWNSLPSETTDFPVVDKFNRSVSNVYLLKFCQVNFTWYQSPYDTAIHFMFYVLCHCMHRNIVLYEMLVSTTVGYLLCHTTATCQRPIHPLLFTKMVMITVAVFPWNC